MAARRTSRTTLIARRYRLPMVTAERALGDRCAFALRLTHPDRQEARHVYAMHGRSNDGRSSIDGRTLLAAGAPSPLDDRTPHGVGVTGPSHDGSRGVLCGDRGSRVAGARR